jgi:hypothetical protein
VKGANVHTERLWFFGAAFVLWSSLTTIPLAFGQATDDPPRHPRFQVIFRDVPQDAVLNPGESLVVPASCGDREVVVGGGYITNPSDPLRVTLNAPFFDGLHSGWRVDFLNAGDTTATVSVRVNVSCTSGTGVGQ